MHQTVERLDPELTMLEVGCEGSASYKVSATPPPRSLTSPNIVVHDKDPIQDVGETRHVSHRVSPLISERPDLSSSGDEGISWKGFAEDLEEEEEVGRVG
jgi:hypothetical protein